MCLCSGVTSSSTVPAVLCNPLTVGIDGHISLIEDNPYFSTFQTPRDAVVVLVLRQEYMIVGGDFSMLKVFKRIGA
jgi:hypothetical protein